MLSIYTMTSPEEAWELVCGSLGIFFTQIDGLYIKDNPVLKELGEQRCKDILDKSRSVATGELYVIVRRLKSHGYLVDAQKVQEILDLVTDGNFATREIIVALEAKNREHNALFREFEAWVVRMRKALP